MRSAGRNSVSPRNANNYNFSTVPRVSHPRSLFNRKHGVKTTFNAGKLYPFLVDEVVPGSTYKVNSTFLCRFATLLKPIMDNVYLETFYFFVPSRILWTNFVRFWGEQDNPTDSIDYVVPQMYAAAPDSFAVRDNQLFDYFGIPPVANVSTTEGLFNALPFRAYNKIYNDWFRDENLQDSAFINTSDGIDVADRDVFGSGNYPIRFRGKRFDYFTSCLPFAQKFDAVSVNLFGTAPVVPTVSNGYPTFAVDGGATQLGPLGSSYGGGTTSNALWRPGANVDPNTSAMYWGSQTGLETDLSNVSAFSINDFRQAVVIQQFYESLARGGSRYVETLMSIYGVSNGDARLQRSEYLGGGHTYINVAPVVQTSGSVDPSLDSSPQASLAGLGVAGSSSGDGHGFVKSFTEHGYVIGLMCIRADLNYQQGLDRFWSRKTKFDFFIPGFANIGEQAVLNKEIYYQGTAADEDVFGYTTRYSDYFTKNSRVCAKFRSVFPDNIDEWHLSQFFTSLPVLSDEFIKEQPPIDRVIAVPTEPHFICDISIDMKTAIPAPRRSFPGLRRI